MIGRVRPAVSGLASYRPGKAASQAEEEHGITGAIKLASNENPWGPAPAVVAAIEQAAAGANRYADHRATALRQAIAEWIDVSPEAVTIGCGSSGLLQQVMHTYVDPGDEVVFPWPSFEIYPVFCSTLDAVQVRTELVDYAFDLDAVAAAVTDRTKVVFLATPNNPTGTAVSMSAVAGMLGRIPDDVIVVVDEAYREFNDPGLGDPVTDLLPAHRNVVVTRTFSKAYGLAGLRVGYAVADPEIVVELDKVLLAFSVSGPAQAGALAAIEHRDEAMMRVSELVAERERVVTTLRRSGWELPAANGNFVFVPTGDRTGEINLAMEKQGVVVRPFSGLGIRVTISTPEENDRWMGALSEASGS
ncbi:MAG: histidinol-phosphate transaminase [Acidimicrobiia bacterium]|nr:histidinol-phosphate transaminase [Acidimicrobiia bacterium]